MPPKTTKKATPRQIPARDGHIEHADRRTARGHTRKTSSPHTRRTIVRKPAHKAKTITPVGDFVRIVNLGGLDEIGRNMSYIEYKNDIVVIDMGFQFPEEDTPGIDYIIPNIAELKPKKDNIRAVVITHGHFDHIGAIPYLMSKLGNPPIYTVKLTKAIIERRQEEFINAPKLNIIEVKYGDKKKAGIFELDFFGVEHTIPDSMGVVVKTPIGNIAHFGDFHLDRDEKGNIYREEEMERVGKMGIHTLMMDSTNALVQGSGISEHEVVSNLRLLLSQAEGRTIVATFSSMLTRIGEMIKIAEELGKKVIINGRSMKQNVQIAETLGYFKFKKGTIIPVQEMNKHKPENILIVTTGAQGEPNAGLMRIVSGEHKFIQIKEGDTFVFSSSVIPGNERSVQSLTDNIARQGAIVYNSQLIDIHKSGHAPQEDLKIVIGKIKPRYLVPVHGYYHFRYVAGQLCKQLGMPESSAQVVDNGDELLLTKDGFQVNKAEVDTTYVMVDGLGVGDVEEVVLRDRRMLAEEGMIVIIATVNRKTGRLIKNPDIISRGFIYLRDNQEMLREMRTKIKSIINRIPRHQQAESDYIKALFRDQVGEFVFKKTHRRPMILPVIIEV
ncbi:MAG: RNA-metabolising metallo-beta-lactamase [Parcubacteria group bacterium GW2011_GWB1_45_7]|nr:MAG: RNA-metabolising metallo-beta-lactamase [Parcubacteria group bacterium GW2011_GWB1_45_7]